MPLTAVYHGFSPPFDGKILGIRLHIDTDNVFNHEIICYVPEFPHDLVGGFWGCNNKFHLNIVPLGVNKKLFSSYYPVQG